MVQCLPFIRAGWCAGRAASQLWERHLGAVCGRGCRSRSGT